MQYQDKEKVNGKCQFKANNESTRTVATQADLVILLQTLNRYFKTQVLCNKKGVQSQQCRV